MPHICQFLLLVTVWCIALSWRIGYASALKDGKNRNSKQQNTLREEDEGISFSVGTSWVEAHGVLEVGRSLSAILFINNTFMMVGGCLDPQCATKSSAITIYDPNTQMTTPAGEIPLFLDIPAPSTKLPPQFVRATIAGPHAMIVVQPPRTSTVEEEEEDEGLGGSNSDANDDLTSAPQPWLIGPCCHYRIEQGNSSQPLVKDLHGGAWGFTADLTKAVSFFTFPPNVPLRANASCQAFGSMVYIIGGILIDSLEPVGTIDALDVSTQTYVPNIALPSLPPLMNPAVTIDNNMMYVVAGQRSSMDCTPSSTNFLWKRKVYQLPPPLQYSSALRAGATETHYHSTGVYEHTLSSDGNATIEVSVCQSTSVVAYFFPSLFWFNQTQVLSAVMMFPDLPTELVVRRTAPSSSSGSSSSSSGVGTEKEATMLQSNKSMSAPDVLRAYSFGGWLLVSAHTEYTAALDLSLPLWVNASNREKAHSNDNSLWTSSKISGVSLRDSTIVFFPLQDLFFGVALGMFCFGGVVIPDGSHSTGIHTVDMSNRVYQRFVAGYLPHVWSSIGPKVTQYQELDIGLQPPTMGLIRLSENLACVGNAAGTSDKEINTTGWSEVASASFYPLFTATTVYVCYSSGPQMLIVPSSVVYPTPAPGNSVSLDSSNSSNTTVAPSTAPPAPTPSPETIIFISFFTVISPFSSFAVVAAPPPPPPPTPPLLGTVEIAVIATCAVVAVVFVFTVCGFVLMRARGAYLEQQRTRRRQQRQRYHEHLLLQEGEGENGGGEGGRGRSGRNQQRGGGGNPQRHSNKQRSGKRRGAPPNPSGMDENRRLLSGGVGSTSLYGDADAATSNTNSGSGGGLWSRLKRLLVLASENEQQLNHQASTRSTSSGLSRSGSHYAPRRSHHNGGEYSDAEGNNNSITTGGGTAINTDNGDYSSESSYTHSSSDYSSRSNSQDGQDDLSGDHFLLHPSDAFANRLLREDPRDKLILNTTSVSRYKVIRKIGEGSFSSVYLVQRREDVNDRSGSNLTSSGRRRGSSAARRHQAQTATYFALKFMICADDRERLEAIKECETINSVQGHPGIIRLYDMFMNYEFEQKNMMSPQPMTPPANAVPYHGFPAKPTPAAKPPAAADALSAADTQMMLTHSARAVQQQASPPQPAIAGRPPLVVGSPRGGAVLQPTAAAVSPPSPQVHTRYLCLVMEYHPSGDLCRYVLRKGKEIRQTQQNRAASPRLTGSPSPAPLVAGAIPLTAATQAAGLFPSTPSSASSIATPNPLVPSHVLSESQLLGIAYQVASVLQFLHGQRPPIVHRDLKPENILIRGALSSAAVPVPTAAGGNGMNNTPASTPGTLPNSYMATSRNNNAPPRAGTPDQIDTLHHNTYIPVAVTDFGLAFIQEEHRKSGRGGGTRPYISPESWKGQTTTASDIWSLGCVLFALATERLTSDTVRVMFQDAKSPNFSRSILTELLRDHQYSPEFAVFIALMLDVDPKRRPTADRLVRMMELHERVEGVTSDNSIPSSSSFAAPTQSYVVFGKEAFGVHGASAMVPQECLPYVAKQHLSSSRQPPSSASDGEEAGGTGVAAARCGDSLLE